ncbi:hypothetical protein BAUCODRAFT_367508 [Baudoinia panamericana UAMH 10762]|uniref:Uncharacterized protein n=1 Tax=Baudoinia panamericana (strain UAMH 10762) TaxID=717646 RepID=M2NL20_BAUPA|nr:uncharacterized protein BAUCODRAFT_367508 [Baudoinia panamericana UAMH 10762]EMD00175.1 hypothetical protein BAUCODRAFT_367508 [Baudoinia panamericana UAMH 10762]
MSASARFARFGGGYGRMSTSQHASSFSYSITRPYPYRWFTPVVVVGFIVFTILFSFLNLVTSGYTLVVQQSADPNATMANNGVWSRHIPAFLTNKVQPSCQTVNVPLGSELFTNQTALTYTLTDVWQPSGGGAAAGNGVAPSLTYFNNILENCTVNSVEIDYAAMDRTASQFAYSEWGAVVRTYATCSIVGTNGTTNFNVTQEYDYVPSDVSAMTLYTFLGTNFLSRNKTSKSSLFWGESLMSMYWAFSTYQMQNIRANQTSNNQPAVRKGTMYFYPNTNKVVSNMTDPDFFQCDFRFIIDKSLGNYDIVYPGSYGEYKEHTQLSTLLSMQAYPNIWQDADILAKAAYSTVLADLGQSSARSNILLDPDQLKYFTANFSEARHNIANAYPGPAVRQYGTEQSGPLGTTPSTLSASYLCQVPQRKSIGNLLISVLVADLVFLQVVCRLMTLSPT